MRTALFAIAARRAPEYSGNIMSQLVRMFGESKCALYEDEVADYLQCLRALNEQNPDNVVGAESHRAAVQFVCRTAKESGNNELTYTAFRSAFLQRFGRGVFSAFKSRIVALLRCIDGLTTPHYFGRLLVRVRAIHRSDDRTQNRCLVRLRHGGEELCVQEKKVPTGVGVSSRSPGGGGSSGSGSEDRGVFLAFQPAQCTADGHLVIQVVPKCRNVFHPNFSCSCASAPDCELSIPLGRIYADGSTTSTGITSSSGLDGSGRVSATASTSVTDSAAVDAWHELGESDGAKITIRLQILFHTTPKLLSRVYASTVNGGAQVDARSPRPQQHRSKTAATTSTTTTANDNAGQTNRTSKGTSSDSTYRATGWLEKTLDAALQDLYSTHTRGRNLRNVHFHIDSGAFVCVCVCVLPMP